MDTDNITIKETPAQTTNILRKHLKSPKRDNSFHYRSIVGMLNFLEKCTRPDISYAVHQCARFSVDPRKPHAAAIRHLARYLAGTKNKGILYAPIEEGLQCYVDADFVGNWNTQEARDDPSTAKSRTGYIVTHRGCPIIWKSQMQSLVTMSTTEAEYVALSTAMREVIPMMQILEEFKENGHEEMKSETAVKCKVFKDNSGAIEIANVPKIRPRTKHINLSYHFFRQFVENGNVKICKIDTEEQPADMLTKPLGSSLHIKHRKKIMGW